jgi:hypothetical protein
VARRKPTAEELEAILAEADEEAEAMPEVRQRRAPDHTPAFLRLTPPANSSEGEGRAYTMPFTPDRERWKRFIKGATDTRGNFDVEIRNKNQSIIGRDSIEVEPEHGAQPYATPQQAGAAQPAPQYATPPATNANDAAQVVSSFADAFVNINKVVKDNTPAPAPQVDVERLISGITEAVRAAQPAAPPDPLEGVARTLGHLRSLGIISDKTQESSREQKNPGEQFLEQLEMFTNISERLGPQPENKGWGAQLGSLAEGMGRAVEKIVPAVPHVLGALRMGAQMLQSQPPASQPQPDAQAQPQGQPAQGQPQQQQLPPGVVSAARALAKEVTRNDWEKGADIVESLMKSESALAFELQQLFALPSVSLVEWLSSVAGAPWLADLPHGVSYFDSLKEELNERAQGEQSDENESDGAEVTTASNNGHRADATAPVQ